MRRSASAPDLPRAVCFSRLLDGAGAIETMALSAGRPTVAAPGCLGGGVESLSGRVTRLMSSMHVPRHGPVDHYKYDRCRIDK